MDSTSTVGAAALGALSAVFVGSLLGLAFMCCKKHEWKASRHILIRRCGKPEVLKEEVDSPATAEDVASGLELEDVRLAPQIDKILNDAQWVDDATGLIPHCLAILKLCHQLTERLMASTLSPLPQYQVTQIIQASRRVSPRLDDVARAMYPPLDPRLLEARCSALTLTLALLAARTHPGPPTQPHAAPHSAPYPSLVQRDIADALTEMDRHVQVLRDAAECHEMFHAMLTQSVTRDEEVF